MSARNFRNLSRAFLRGHITVVSDAAGRVTMHRKVKSDKVGAGGHSRWVKNIHHHHEGGQLSEQLHKVPQKWASV